MVKNGSYTPVQLGSDAGLLGFEINELQRKEDASR